MFCDRCGSQVREGAMFCSKCGNKISSIEFSGNGIVPSVDNSFQKTPYDKRIKQYFEEVIKQYVLISNLEDAKRQIMSIEPMTYEVPHVEEPKYKSVESYEVEMEYMDYAKKWYLSIYSWFAMTFFLLIAFIMIFLWLGGATSELSSIIIVLPWIITLIIRPIIIFVVKKINNDDVKRQNKIIKRNNKIIEQKNEQLKAAYERKLEIKKEESKQIFEVKKIAWQKEVDKVEHYLAASKEVLQKLYDCDVIYSKYRNITAILYIKDALESKRVHTLEDAYNFFETDNRLDGIRSSILDISKQLNTVIEDGRRMSYMIAMGIENAKELGDMITERMNHITSNQKNLGRTILEMQQGQEVIARNTESLRFITNVSGKRYDLSNLLE